MSVFPVSVELIVAQTYGSLVPDSGRYLPPEIVKTGWEAIKQNPVTAVDAYDFGILIYEAFNGSYMGTDQLSQPKSIPPSMQQSYKRLVNANPKARISVGSFLEQGQRSGGFFETPLINITDTVENLGLKSQAEREEFLAYALCILIVILKTDKLQAIGRALGRLSRRFFQDENLT